MHATSAILEPSVPMLYSLRHAVDADRAWLEQLRRTAHEHLFHATWGGWDASRHQRQFAASWQRGRIQLIEVDGRPVGMIQLRERDDCVEIGEIQVSPEHQNRGLGTRLLADVIDRARERGRDVVLSSGLMNAGAHRLFGRLGFVETDRSDTHVHMRCHTSAR